MRPQPPRSNTNRVFLLKAPSLPAILRAMEFPHVTAIAKANVYFEGKVVSHTIIAADGEKKTLGIIYPGTYHFGTDAAEHMLITAGLCDVVLDGRTESRHYTTGHSFDVPAKSGFTITVADGLCQYVCSFLG